ncbi:hypothetical protein KY290_005113 [Solanum tuberosum]|uniref:Uncharacterized protein n=1 Tax=Solanum tuberosum TaxID=4113 RepID=A0ABQ7WD83_SOLTU|nr:hypothetical protein KY290_005113 [Solanum tuberosum]
MLNPSSPLRTPLSLEMVNPNPFRFSTPPTEPSSSTPMCGMGETGESIMPQTKVVDQSLVNPVEGLPCSPTLLFDGDLPEGKVTKSNILATSEEWLVQSLVSLKGVIQLSFSKDECKSPDPILNRFKPVFHQAYDIAAPTNASQREYVKNDEDIPLSWTRKGVR